MSLDPTEKNGAKAVLVPQSLSQRFSLPAGYACVRSLGMRDVRTIVASVGGTAPETKSRYCDEALSIPPPEDDLLAYKDALVDIASRPDVRTVIPTREEDSYVLSKYREEFAEHVSLPVPDFETLRTVHDRIRLAEAANDAGVPAPEVWPLDEVPDWDRELLIKSRYNILVEEYVESLSPGESHTVKAQTHLRAGDPPDVDALRAEMKHMPIAQEFVPRANEYMFAALCDHGEALATFQHQQIRGNSYVGGGGVYRESVYRPDLEAVARRLLDQLNWHGLACIEYIEDARTGELKLAEINPRMWQSGLATLRMGAEFPYWYWLHARGRMDLIEPGYDLGVGCHYLKGEIGYLLSVLRDESALVERPAVPGTLWDLASSLLKHPRFDYLQADDPLPFLYDGSRRVTTVSERQYSQWRS